MNETIDSDSDSYTTGIEPALSEADKAIMEMPEDLNGLQNMLNNILNALVRIATAVERDPSERGNWRSTRQRAGGDGSGEDGGDGGDGVDGEDGEHA